MGRVKVQPVYVPFRPSGVRIGKRLAEAAQRKFSDNPRSISNYGIDQDIRKYLFETYNAEIVKVNHELMIRFCSEEQKFLYLLSEGA